MDRPPNAQDDGDELPTYANLEAQANAEGGASAARWNRWRGWIEKRAAERFAEDPNQSRRPTGWGPSSDDPFTSPIPQSSTDLNRTTNEPSTARPSPRRKSTRLTIPPPDYVLPEPVGSIGHPVEPSRLALHNFGSRFLPHSTEKIFCMIPILSDKFLLIGTAQGLSVIDVYPALHLQRGDQPLALKPADSAHPMADSTSIPIWVGEAVYQLDILEDATSEATLESPQGVVLALVGPPEDDSIRSVRMYNLASLSSLVHWYATQKEFPPLDMARATGTQNGASALAKKSLKKARHQSDITKGFRSLLIDELKVSSSSVSPSTALRPTEKSRTAPQSQPPTSPPRLAGISPYTTSPGPSITTLHQNGSPPLSAHIPKSPSQTSVASSSWDVIDERPMRWASDYVPFAGPNSRLANVTVCFYELWKSRDNKIPTSLALTTKTNILLYETPRNERAFKFVKEFYTPTPAKSVSFIRQADTQHHHRHRSSASSGHVQSLSRRASGASSKRRADYGTQLCLFVAFDKKAGLIRVGDAAVMEVDPPETDAANLVPTNFARSISPSFSFDSVAPVAGSLRRHLVASIDGSGLFKGHPPWLPLVELQLPSLVPISQPSNTALPDTPRPASLPNSICFITRGRITAVYPVPLPMSFGSRSAATALTTIMWQSQPARIQPRISFQPESLSEPSEDATPSIPRPAPPFLQIVAFGEEGVEVQELSLGFLTRNPDPKGKGKSRTSGEFVDPQIRAFADVGGAAGFLSCGGQWNRPVGLLSPVAESARGALNSPIGRQDSWASMASGVLSPTGSRAGGFTAPVAVNGRNGFEGGGIYGWAMKGVEDYRVFWLGESAA